MKKVNDNKRGEFITVFYINKVGVTDGWIKIVIAVDDLLYNVSDKKRFYKGLGYDVRDSID